MHQPDTLDSKTPVDVLLDYLKNDFGNDIKPLSDQINALATQISNWIVYKNGFKSDSAVALMIAGNAIKEYNPANLLYKGVRYALGDKSAAEFNSTVRYPFQIINDPYSKIANSTQLLTRLILVGGLWLSLGGIVGVMASELLGVSLALTLPIPWLTATLGLLKSYESLTFYGLSVSTIFDEVRKLDDKPEQDTSSVNQHNAKHPLLSLDDLAQLFQARSNPVTHQAPHSSSRPGSGASSGSSASQDDGDVNDNDSENESRARYRYFGQGFPGYCPPN